MNILIVRDDFSPTPGSRSTKEGEYSGEVFREKHLLPVIKKSIESQVRLRVVLDGTAGYGTSFLEEAFGGLIRENRLNYHVIKNCLEIISNEEPYLESDIYQYLSDAHKEQS